MSKPSTPAEQKRIDRRRFLTTFAMGASAVPLFSLSRSLLAGSAAPAAPSLCYSNKRVIGPGDFSYLGAMRVPQELSSFSFCAMSARKVNGRLQFFMAGENSANAVANWGSMDCVWEFADTNAYNQNYAAAQRATVLTKWGDVYHGKRTSWDNAGQQLNLNYLLTRALLYKNGRLYWTYDDGYNVSQRNDWCIGMTDLATGTAYGPWRPNIGVKHAAGWLVDMPDGTLGMGMPLSSGNIASSWGPELTAGAQYPGPATPSGYGTPDLNVPDRYMRYGFPSNSIAADGSVVPGRTIPSLLRDGNYIWHDPRSSPGGAGVSTQVDPAKNGGVGSWTEIDGANGCVYIDLPDKHGILFAGSVGIGHLWYGYATDCGHGFGNPCPSGQGPNATAFEPRWWIYDPDDCQRAIAGNLPRNLTPAVVMNPNAIHPLQMGCQKNFGGIYFDVDTRRLYLAARQADVSVPGLFCPLIHVFQLA